MLKRVRAFRFRLRGKIFEHCQVFLRVSFDELGASGGEALALERLAEVEMLRGNLEQAHALLDEALAVARDSNLGFHLFDRIYGARISAAPTPATALAAVEAAESAGVVPGMLLVLRQSTVKGGA